MASQTSNVKMIRIDERDINSGRVMEMTEPFVCSEGLQITVPANHHAYIIHEDEAVAVMKSGAHKKLPQKVLSQCVGERVSVLYVSNRPFTAMSWGIGTLPMVYTFLDSTKLNIGANGTLIPRLSDPYAFYKLFDKEEGRVDLAECASAITSAFRRCASEVLVELFREACQPIFETEFLISEMNRRLNKRYCTEEPVDVIDGVVFCLATVQGITVNEEDKRALIEKFGRAKKK